MDLQRGEDASLLRHDGQVIRNRDGFRMCGFVQDRRGAKSLAAARVFKVPLDKVVGWMKEAETLFSREVPIAWLHATRPSTFIAWLGAARRSRLAFVPPDAAGDEQLAAQMCKEEHSLLGYEPGKSNARTNAASMELLRWLLLDKPRPQMAFCFLLLPAAQAHLRGERSQARRHDAADLGVAVGAARVQGHL
jgi:hypothetical protein